MMVARLCVRESLTVPTKLNLSNLSSEFKFSLELLLHIARRSAYMCSLIDTHMQSHTHAHTHAHKPTHAHTRTHTHTHAGYKRNDSEQDAG